MACYFIKQTDRSQRTEVEVSEMKPRASGSAMSTFIR